MEELSAGIGRAAPPDYNSPLALKAFMEARGMAMQKRFGQNFLVNGAARARLADALDVLPGTCVWEVGPGLGAVTSELLRRGADVTCFEIDRGFSGCLRQFFAPQIESGRLRLIEGDVLDTWRPQLEARTPMRFFGNLPYNVAATIIADTISASVRFERAVVTVQKEVAERMAAAPASGGYSSFSVLCQWAYKVRPVLDLAGGSFWPKPKVASRAVLLERRTEFPACKDAALFMGMQRALFASRRKTVRNNLTRFLSSAETARAALHLAGIEENLRAEALRVEQLLHLSDCIHELGGNMHTKGGGSQ